MTEDEHIYTKNRLRDIYRQVQELKEHATYIMDIVKDLSENLVREKEDK